jgi:hypothetical protein
VNDFLHYLPPDLCSLGWRVHPLDVKLLLFDRDSGLSGLLEGEETAHFRRTAPRRLLIAVANACNPCWGDSLPDVPRLFSGPDCGTYEYAYQLVTIAAQIDQDNHYQEDQLPFPSLLTDDQRQQALEAVEKWRERLTQLRSEQT